MASQHSYLPSAEAVCQGSSATTSSSPVLPVLFLPIVLVPGVKLPLRISSRNAALSAYLRRELQQSTHAIRIGIMYQELDDEDDSWTRRATRSRELRRLSEQLIREIDQGLLEDDEEPAEDTTSTTNDEADDDPVVNNNRLASNGPLPDRRWTNNRSVGQIGTVATVLFQHKDDEQHQSRGMSTELVVTAIGTTRFCILGLAQQEPVPLYHVQEILDEPLRKRPSTTSSRVVRSLVPTRILQETWRLTDELHQYYQEQSPPREPVTLSFWCIQHLLHTPAQQNSMLQRISVTERLRDLRSQLLVRHCTTTIMVTSSFLCCRECHHPLAKTPQDIITVPGADGTSGNYVNAHGVVHSTITIRAVPDVVLRTMSEPETQDRYEAAAASVY